MAERSISQSQFQWCSPLSMIESEGDGGSGERNEKGEWMGVLMGHFSPLILFYFILFYFCSSELLCCSNRTISSQ